MIPQRREYKELSITISSAILFVASIVSLITALVFKAEYNRDLFLIFLTIFFLTFFLTIVSLFYPIITMGISIITYAFFLIFIVKNDVFSVLPGRKKPLIPMIGIWMVLVLGFYDQIRKRGKSIK